MVFGRYSRDCSSGSILVYGFIDIFVVRMGRLIMIVVSCGGCWVCWTRVADGSLRGAFGLAVLIVSTIGVPEGTKVIVLLFIMVDFGPILRQNLNEISANFEKILKQHI